MKNKLQYLGDGYKFSHKELYDSNIDNVFTNLVPRALRYMETYDDKVVAYGVNYLSYKLKQVSNDFFNEEFDVAEYNEIIKGDKLITADDWLELKELGYLPIIIKGVKDNTIVDVQTPVIHVETTDSRFFWLGQYLETFISQTYWPLMTSATKSRELAYVMNYFSKKTSDSKDNLWRLHDFGCRGHVGTEASVLQGMGHLLYSGGSDTTIAQFELKNVFPDFETAPIVNASEHSVMCSYGEENEEALFEKLLDNYKDTLLSVVIDGFDQDNFIYNVIPKFADKIRERKYPLVLRPDSGDMVRTMLKYIRILDNTFGHSINSKGYKVVNNVNLIWGDGCTDENIFNTLSITGGTSIVQGRGIGKGRSKGYSVDNFLFGVGSYYYQSSTRDTLNIAIKATAIQKGDKIINTMKKVKSDRSKASLSGLVAVDNNGKVIQDIQSKEEFDKIDSRKVYFKNSDVFLDAYKEVKNVKN